MITRLDTVTGSPVYVLTSAANAASCACAGKAMYNNGTFIITATRYTIHTYIPVLLIHKHTK